MKLFEKVNYKGDLCQIVEIKGNDIVLHYNDDESDFYFNVKREEIDNGC